MRLIAGAMFAADGRLVKAVVAAVRPRRRPCALGTNRESQPARRNEIVATTGRPHQRQNGLLPIADRMPLTINCLNCV